MNLLIPEVGDHDFTKFSIIPSVSLVVDLPDDVGIQVEFLLELKKVFFSHHHHMLTAKSLLFIYTDEGPDH